MPMSRSHIAGRWRCCRPDRSGSALLITLLVLTGVTIIGIACINTTIVEMKISSNGHEMRESFYLAESAAMEGVQRLINISDVDLNERILSWHHPRRDPVDGAIDFRDPTQWDADGVGQGNCLQSALDPNAFMAAVEWKVAAGGSLVMTESRLYQNRVYGRCTKHDNGNLIEIGYNVRY